MSLGAWHFQRQAQPRRGNGARGHAPRARSVRRHDRSRHFLPSLATSSVLRLSVEGALMRGTSETRTGERLRGNCRALSDVLAFSGVSDGFGKSIHAFLMHRSCICSCIVINSSRIVLHHARIMHTSCMHHASTVHASCMHQPCVAHYNRVP